MSRLKVRLRGKLIYDINLNPEHSYVAGRKEDCDIVLQAEKGISREHFKLFFENDGWHVQVVSRYGEVIYNGQMAQQFTLESGSQFSIPPYEFDFSTANEELSPSSSHEFSHGGGHLPALTNAGVVANAYEGNEEKTVIGVAPLVAYIKVVDKENEAKEIIRLDAGESWIAGRDPSCHIQIRDQRVSRRQFEIRKVGPQYVIIDLESVNGTLLNGTPISATDPVSIKSGDSICVLNNFLYFELHDAYFKERLESVKLSPINSLVATSHEALPEKYQNQSHELMHHQDMAPMPYQSQMQYPAFPNAGSGLPADGGIHTKKKFDFEKNRPKLIIGAIVILTLAYFFSDDGEEARKPPHASVAAAPGSPQEMFAKLKPEQQALVRQRYKDAKNLYMQGKYQLAQDEIVKLQELVPDYEDIKEIDRLSKEAIFIQGQQRRQEEIEKAKVETEEKIQKQANECQKKINPAITMAQLEDCLSPILQFNPEHPRILALKAQVESLIAQKEAKEAEKVAYQSQVAKLKSLYEHAHSIEKKGKPLDAIAAYEKVLGVNLPDPHGLKSQIKRNIASIRQTMNSKTASLQAEADKYYQAQNLKGAILALRKARVLDPANPAYPDKIDQYTTELRKEMMKYYQEGILEESFGNLDGGESKNGGAKEKWKKILDLDIPEGEYYRKAFIKLKKYGAL
ncbi:MAG: FHA domain-containing protein [Pseudobdellovibrionaceae bacterium]